MQKKLIVLAIAALASTSAFADSTVGVYGVADAAVVNIAGSNQHSQLMAVSGGLATSRFGINAAEDLGDGLKAVVNLEYGLDVESATTVGAGGSPASPRQQLLGLAGDFGTIATGYLQTAGNDFSKNYDPAGGSSVSALQNVTGSHFLLGAKGADVRATRALAYISPNFNGLSFALNYATSLNGLGDAGQPSANDAINQTAMLGAVTYAAGPLSVNVTYASNASYNTYVAATAATVKNVNGTVTAVAAVPASETSTAADSEVAVGLTYDAGVAKIFATYQSNTPSGGTSTAAYSVSATVPVSSSVVALSYAANTATNSSGATGYTAALLHPMSKTTTAYVAYSGVTNGNNSASFSVDNSAVANATMGNGGSSSLIALGLNKKF
jgi:predicted porin